MNHLKNAHNILNSRDTRNNQEAWKFYKPGHHYGRIHEWIVEHAWYKQTQEYITCKNLGWQGKGLVNRIFNDPAPLQMCGFQIKQILLFKHLKSVQPLGNTLWIRIFSYIDLRTYFHLLCNYSHTNLLISSPAPHPQNPPPPKK